MKRSLNRKVAMHTYTGRILTKEVFRSEVIISEDEFTCSAMCLSTDLNRDGTVNILDITVLATAYNRRPRDPNWNETEDLDKNGQINIVDVTMVVKDYGKSV